MNGSDDDVKRCLMKDKIQLQAIVKLQNITIHLTREPISRGQHTASSSAGLERLISRRKGKLCNEKVFFLGHCVIFTDC